VSDEHGGTSGDASGRPAVFLDRDGTLIDDVHYIARPELVVLRPGAAAAVRRLNERGWPVVVVTNQSGIARGLISEAAYEAVRKRIDALLAAEGARLDATYHCPHHPDIGGACDCRKPGVALFAQAAREHGLDASRSVFVGDRWRDVAPALRFGGRGILVPSPDTPAEDVARAEREAEVAPTLADAVTRILPG
jgi:D-glycero-D-manno-heptose 1,7-bisphosphate phosphatase